MTQREDPRDSFTVDFTVDNARVVATLGSDGGALVEQVTTLHCSEGRLYTFQLAEDGADLHAFEYYFGFHQVDDGDPLASRSVEARIVIEGTHSSGNRLEIRGNGWIGYDDKGNLEGHFEAPPVILTDDWPEPDSESGDPADPNFEPLLDFPTPPQFARALVRFPPVNDD